jgi:DNA-binding MarR family transcriptional regulator
MKKSSELEQLRATTAELLLETIPSVMGYVSSELRRSSPVETSIHFRLLRALRRSTRNLHELASMHSVRLPTMSRTVSVLEGRGWIIRERSKQDRRTVYVSITEEGGRVLRDVEKMAVSRASDLLACVGPEDLEHLQRGMDALHRTIRDQLGMSPEEDPVAPDVSGCKEAE